MKDEIDWSIFEPSTGEGRRNSIHGGDVLRIDNFTNVADVGAQSVTKLEKLKLGDSLTRVQTVNTNFEKLKLGDSLTRVQTVNPNFEKLKLGDSLTRVQTVNKVGSFNPSPIFNDMETDDATKGNSYVHDISNTYNSGINLVIDSPKDENERKNIYHNDLISRIENSTYQKTPQFTVRKSFYQKTSLFKVRKYL